ncbi:MAG: hypothetical protein RL417_1303, partial [Pseudomonadota bacterium]
MFVRIDGGGDVEPWKSSELLLGIYPRLRKNCVGKLARFGIVGGERVSVQTLGCLPVPIPTHDFAERALKQLGFNETRERVIHRKRLERSEIERLITRAPLSVLMKLVELGAHASAQVAPTPILALSLGGELHDPALYLSQIEHPALEVLLDEIDLRRLGDGLEERIAEIAKARPGLTLVGPAAEDILAWLHANGRRSAALENLTLTEVVRRLREAGISRLRACRDFSALTAVNSTGMGQSFCTALDRFADAAELADHLIAVAELSERDGLVNVWFPGFSRSCRTYPVTGAALDLMLLRMLAVGTLTLPSVARRRASSRYLSIES